MKKIIVISILLVYTGFYAFSQTEVKPNYYAVYFRDKANNSYSIDKPQDFLSARALQRRKKYHIVVTSQDLPVNKIYIEKLKSMGFEIKEVSKWLNCAIVYTKDSSLVKKVSELKFVHPKPFYPKKKYRIHKIRQARVRMKKNIENKEKNRYNYGIGTYQAEMLNIQELHNMGYDGKGIEIAIMDAGFQHINKLPAFDSLWANHQILGWYDFVDNDTTLFNVGTHGMMVLSTIGGNTTNFVGTAPKASFYLYRTEDEKTEYPIEEYNYVCACEKADSLGVDLIHSSLGYNNFNDTTMSYTYKDMNGNTAISSIGADIAASKGIMVVASAGNEGDVAWKYITAPADADSVLSVGAVNYKGKYAFFSSIGPSYDGRVKPNVVAMGQSAAVEGIGGYITYASGTSFAGPIMAGAVACLMQAFPYVNNIDMIYAIERCSSFAKKPNPKYGYGIPNFYKAYLFLKKKHKK